MRIKMLGTYPGSNDGIQVQMFKENEVYEVDNGISEDLAKTFLEMGAAEKIILRPRKKGATEDKSIKPKENK